MDLAHVRQLSSSEPKLSLGIDSNLSAWVHTGVAIFAQRHLPEADKLFSDMQSQSCLAERLGLQHRSWFELNHYLAKNIGLLNLPPQLMSLARNERLNLLDIFIFALCGEIERSHALGLACAALQSPNSHAYPSLHLLKNLVEDLFSCELNLHTLLEHSLVRKSLIAIHGDGPLPTKYLSVKASIWAVLHGGSQQWPKLEPIPVGDSYLLPESVGKLLESIVQLFQRGQCRGLVLRGNPKLSKILAAEIAGKLSMAAMGTPQNTWQEDEVLHFVATHTQWMPVVDITLGPGEVFRPQPRFYVPSIFICGQEGNIDIDQVLEIHLDISSPRERSVLWQRYLPELAATDGVSLELARLDGANIKTLAKKALLDAQGESKTVSIEHVLRARSGLVGATTRQLAQPVLRRVNEDALILPDNIKRSFQQLIERCKQREYLWRGLGDAAQASSNYGVRALLCGESGTGKTLAASYLATALAAPLYRLDLASVMNKYVGETEKNLALLLDEAVTSDTILLFDEADALFGKRTDGEASGDRFANMLTNFLLTRIENHQGIVILTSNNRSRIDPAFTRRLDAIIDFSNPSAQERYLIWLNHLGSRAPSEEFCKLLASYCELQGGFIRNAVLNAAAINPSCSEALSEISLIESLVEEYKKLGRSIPVAINQLRVNYG